MRGSDVVVCLLVLIAATSGCVPTQRYEQLQAKHDELAQNLEDTKSRLDATHKDHLNASDKYEQNVSNLRQRLAAEQRRAAELKSQLEPLQRAHDAAAAAAYQSAKDNLSLIGKKKKLNDIIIELKGTILTLRDTIKDLETRLQEQTSKP
jgi:chromosome segregation ATPase